MSDRTFTILASDRKGEGTEIIGFIGEIALTRALEMRVLDLEETLRFWETTPLRNSEGYDMLREQHENCLAILRTLTRTPTTV